ncbi:MAG: hypothetical protein ABL962_11060, partial [Fimbriimonadaceae bacterium]
LRFAPAAQQPFTAASGYGAPSQHTQKAMQTPAPRNPFIPASLNDQQLLAHMGVRSPEELQKLAQDDRMAAVVTMNKQPPPDQYQQSLTAASSAVRYTGAAPVDPTTGRPYDNTQNLLRMCRLVDPTNNSLKSTNSNYVRIVDASANRAY